MSLAMSKEKTVSTGPALSPYAATHPAATPTVAASGTESPQPIAEATAVTPEWRSFFHTLAASKSSVLLLDFDGTLAPFRLDPSKVRPWAGVTAMLDQIQQTGRTRIVFVSGRPAQNVATQLGLSQPPEVWGLHGGERLLPDGSMEYEKLPLRKQLHLKAANKALEESGWLHRGIRLESKWNAVVVHWRGLTAHKATEAQTAIQQLFAPIASDGNLETLLFDGGFEMRAGRTKGDSVHLVLSEMHRETPAVYLGDDTTDEFAFHAINAETQAGRGLSVLVRRQWRPTAARLWIRPPARLRAFLNDWLRATQSR